ncbi:uncharacterized protein LOC123037522 [Drosophila rhopaloa]|uniref:Uncharacterized protein n=1 Tax=Drosophila rhopaloa TaxID=1041015 RepID=A0ABM5J6V0_DRORH|nr:uncharacterized protein LOC123037522 [Drosophila rhopaloa]
MSRRKLDLELVLSTLLKAVRLRKNISRPEARAADEDQIERFSGNHTAREADHSEGFLERVYNFILELTMPILEKMFDFVENVILQAVGFVENAVEVFIREVKVQQAALEALVKYLTNYLGFAITY